MRRQQKKELNVQTNIKTANRKELWLKALVNSGYTHIGINKHLVKEEKIKMESLETPFKVYNTNRIKNRKAIQFVSLEMKINEHIENISIVVTDLNSMDIFLRYDWLVKHNPQVNYNKETIQFTRCLKECKTLYQDISLKPRNRRNGQRTSGNKKETGPNKSRRLIRVYLIYLSIQQEEIWEITRKKRIGL